MTKDKQERLIIQPNSSPKIYTYKPKKPQKTNFHLNFPVLYLVCLFRYLSHESVKFFSFSFPSASALPYWCKFSPYNAASLCRWLWNTITCPSNLLKCYWEVVPRWELVFSVFPVQLSSPSRVTDSLSDLEQIIWFNCTRIKPAG